MSTNKFQLNKICESLEDKHMGISLRTPYGISGESWGHVIVACTTNTPNNISPYELYTMIRSSSDKTYIFGTNDFFDNHPLVRNFDIQIIN